MLEAHAHSANIPERENNDYTFSAEPFAARKYRSKRQRPCDLCRNRKVHCKIVSIGTACELCQKLNRNCTFVLQPPKRRPRQIDGRPGESSNGHTIRDQHSIGSSQRGGEIDTKTYDMQDAAEVEEDEMMSPNYDDAHFLDDQGPSPFNNIDWSYLELNISPTKDDYDLAGPQSAERGPVSDSSPVSTWDQILSRPPGDSQSQPPQPSEVSEGRLLNGDSKAALSAQERLPENDNDWSDAFSLDRRPGYSSQLIGASNETDPFLLRHYVYDRLDTFRMFKLDFRKVTDDAVLQHQADLHGEPTTEPQLHASEIPTQFVMINETICEEDIDTVDKDFSSYRTESQDAELLREIVPPDLGTRLLELFFKFVQPSYPVLSQKDWDEIATHKAPQTIPTGLMAAVYALAAPFYFLDDELAVGKGYQPPSSEDLWRIAHRSLQRNFQRSHLSLVQLGLLLLHRPPQNFAVADSAGSWALACSVLAAAESLGLNLDPSDWRLPRHEIQLRRRLWWLVYVEHTWRAMVMGRPSHINAPNWSVSDLTLDDFENDDTMDEDVRRYNRAQRPYLLAMCNLSQIANDILSSLYSIQSMRHSRNLNQLLAIAHPLRIRLQQWRQELPPGVLKPSLAPNETSSSDVDEDEGLEHTGPVRLTYLSLELMIFRALLRPLSYQAGGGDQADQADQGPRSTIFKNSQTCAKLIMELVATLQARHFAQFWPSYTRYQLSYMSNFAMLLFVQSPTDEVARENKTLLEKWRNTIRMQSRAWPVLKLAVMRLNAIVWTGLDQIVGWAGKDSPAARLLQEQAVQKGGRR